MGRDNIRFVLLLLLTLSLILVNGTSIDESINKIIDKHYSKLIKNLKTQHPHLRDFEEDITKQFPSKHLPNYQCQHDHISNEDKFPIIIDQSELLSNGIFNNTKTTELKVIKPISEANEVNNIRITFDTSLIQVGADPLYTCYQSGNTVKVDTEGSVSSTCQSDGSVTPCIFTCSSDYLVSSGLITVLENYIIQAISDILTEVISVESVQGNLILTQGFTSCHYGVPIPESTRTTGIPNSDYHVFVTARPTSASGTIAYAKSCVYPTVQDSNGATIRGRPIAGLINFNPFYFGDFIENPTGFLFREYARVGLHEFTHALGFSVNFYPSFIGSNGAKYSPPPGTTYSFSKTTPAGVAFTENRALITTPSVVSFARSHYQCDDPNFTYQELENAGGAGTASSHWEKRSAGEELMLGYIQPMFPLTNLTLSLLQDTGWYKIDFSFAEPLLWGKKLGCDWISGCTAETWDFPGYWCSSTVQTCSPTRAGKGSCAVQTYVSLPSSYQHFVNPNVTGAQYSSVADYCPYTTESVYCQDEGNQGSANTGIGEVYGTDSKCFEYSQIGETGNGMACLTQRCVNETYEIYILGTWYSCPEGTTLNVSSYLIPCPNFYYPCTYLDFIPPTDSSSSESLDSSSGSIESNNNKNNNNNTNNNSQVSESTNQKSNHYYFVFILISLVTLIIIIRV